MSEPYSLDRYRRILEHALARGYRVQGFADEPAAGNVLYLRHDVDYSLGMAVELARVNHALGVAGTFCVLLRGQVYNVLSAWSLRQARSLLELGQRVALHVALPGDPPASLAELAGFVRADFELLLRHLPEADPVFAWHNPTPEVLGGTAAWDVPGLVNAYHERFVRAIPYRSDSNLRNAPADFERLLAEGHPRVHLLFHPLNWVAGGESMADIFARTWPWVLREREEEFRCNRAYQALFPGGMPADAAEAFSRAWLAAAGKAR